MPSETALDRLIRGHQHFRKSYESQQYHAYRQSAPHGQAPKIMVIACCDSRVSPAIVMGAALGEIFTVTNVANLIAPYDAHGKTHHSTGAAIEYAVNHLHVEHIIVLGHSDCGGIKALVSGGITPEGSEYSFITPWMQIAAPARAGAHKGADFATACHDFERASLVNSLENLQTFPWVQRALADGTLGIHAWHFDIASGRIERYDGGREKFVPLIE